jgi:hypothetical protein
MFYQQSSAGFVAGGWEIMRRYNAWSRTYAAPSAYASMMDQFRLYRKGIEN